MASAGGEVLEDEIVLRCVVDGNQVTTLQKGFGLGVGPLQGRRRYASIMRLRHLRLATLSFIALAPSASAEIETLYVVEFAHADVGFNAPPSKMQDRNHTRNVLALDLADTYPEYRWVIETGYQLETFLDRATPEEESRLAALLAEGRFDYGANFTNMRTGYVGEEQHHRLLYPSLEHAQRLGTAAVTVFLDDVPGFTLATPRLLASAGVPYAVLGPNSTFGGHPDIPLSDRAFWWQGRDGSRVLTWRTYGSYAEGYVEWGMLNLSTMERKVPLRIAEFEEDGYPYDAVLVCRAFDDHMPNWSMVKLARDWNAVHETPTVRIATAREFFEHMEGTYGDDFPIYEGDAAGQWEDVTTVTPVSTGWVRQARSALPDLEALWVYLDLMEGFSYPKSTFADAWKNSLVFDEHSGGGMGWPGLLPIEEVRQENREHVAMARRARSLATQARTDGLAAFAPPRVPEGETGIVVLNPLGTEFVGVIEVECGAPQPPETRIVDVVGGEDAVFRWTRNDRSALAFHGSVPPRGWARWRVARDGAPLEAPEWSDGERLRAGDLELMLDSETGTGMELIDHARALDWIASADGRGLGGIEAGANLDVFFGITHPSNPKPVEIRIEEACPLFRRAVVFDSGLDFIREYRLFERETRVDLALYLRRSALPFVPFDLHSHHYGVHFPGNLVPPTTLYVDGPDGFFRPGAESLPGVGLAHFGHATGGILGGSAGRWLALSSPDAPMLDLGEMDGAALPELETDETTLTAKLIRHADEGMVQGGDVVEIEAEPGTPDWMRFRFQIRFGDDQSEPPTREVFRRDVAPPLVAWVDEGEGDAAVAPSGSFFVIDGPAQLVAAKRGESGRALVLRLRGGSAGGIANATFPFPVTKADLCDLLERPITPLVVDGSSVEIPLTARGVVTVRVEAVSTAPHEANRGKSVAKHHFQALQCEVHVFAGGPSPQRETQRTMGGLLRESHRE